MAAATSAAQPLVGLRVKIDGLVSKPELNGTEGFADEFDDAKGRYNVRLDATGAVMALKPTNLTAAVDGMADSCPPDSSDSEEYASANEDEPAPSKPKIELAEEWKTRGNTHFKAKEWDTAIACYTEAIDIMLAGRSLTEWLGKKERTVKPGTESNGGPVEMAEIEVVKNPWLR